MRDRELEFYVSPSLLSILQTSNNSVANFRDAILYKLADSPPETVLQDKKIAAETLVECREIYNFGLNKLLKKKGVAIPKDDNKCE